MQLLSQNFTLVPNFDNSLDGAYPSGNKAPTLAWNSTGLPNLLGIAANTPTSFNARSLLAGDGAASAVITLIPISGDGAGGYSVQPDGSTVASNGAVDSGVFALQATYLGLTVTSSAIPWSFLAAQTGGSGFRFAPGFYIADGTGGHDGGDPSKPGTGGYTLLNTYLPQIIGTPVRGWVVNLRPADYVNGTGPTDPNRYVQGRKNLKAVLDAFHAAGKYCMLNIVERTFGACNGAIPNGQYPQYWIDNGWVVANGPKTVTLTAAPPQGATSGTLTAAYPGVNQTLNTVFSTGEVHAVSYTKNSTNISWSGSLTNSTNGTGLTIQGNPGSLQSIVTTWLAAANTEWLAMWSDVAANFDNHPALVMCFPYGETAIGPNTPTLNYNAFVANLLTGHQTLRGKFTQTPLRCLFNYTGSNSQSFQLMDTLALLGGQYVGGPDPQGPGPNPPPTRVINGWQNYQGLDSNGNTIHSSYVGGPLGFCAEFEAYISGQVNNPGNLIELARQTVKPNYWVCGIYSGNAAFTLPAWIAAINAAKPGSINTTPPTGATFVTLP
jgi:hypothetical protein